MALALGHDELEKQAAIVDEQRRQEATRTDASSRFILDIQSSLLYSMNWSEFLSAAPMAISLMGACYVASTVPGATSITLSPPEGGFKHLRSYNHVGSERVKTVLRYDIIAGGPSMQT
jgi:hypothetical protein